MPESAVWEPDLTPYANRYIDGDKSSSIRAGRPAYINTDQYEMVWGGYKKQREKMRCTTETYKLYSAHCEEKVYSESYGIHFGGTFTVTQMAPITLQLNINVFHWKCLNWFPFLCFSIANSCCGSSINKNSSCIYAISNVYENQRDAVKWKGFMERLFKQCEMFCTLACR